MRPHNTVLPANTPPQQYSPRPETRRGPPPPDRDQRENIPTISHTFTPQTPGILPETLRNSSASSHLLHGGVLHSKLSNWVMSKVNQLSVRESTLNKEEALPQSVSACTLYILECTCGSVCRHCFSVAMGEKQVLNNKIRT